MLIVRITTAQIDSSSLNRERDNRHNNDLRICRTHIYSQIP